MKTLLRCKSRVVTPALALILLGLMVVADAAAQARQDEEVVVYAGYVVFPDPLRATATATVEFPFTVDRDAFEFYRPDQSEPAFYARIFAQVDLMNPLGETIDSVATYFSARVADQREAAIPGIKLFNTLSLQVKPGVYSARLTIIDAVSKRQGESFLARLVVDPVVTDGISIGGPMLAYQVSRVADTTGVQTQLLHNGFLVRHNPLSVFAATDSVIYLYAELYNLDISEEADQRVLMTYEVFRGERLTRPLGSKYLRKPSHSIAFAEQFGIAGWLTGLYRLRIIARDMQTGAADTTETPFRIVTRQEVARAIEQSNTDDPYNMLTLDEQVQLVRYLLTPPELRTIQQLAPTGKRTFLEQYWKEHDDHHPSGINQRRAELVERFHYANQHFSTNEEKDDGWQTDRGRIYMTWGPWDELDDHQVPSKRMPFQVWYYYQYKEGKYFVFEDWQDNDEYRLVHSNVYGEVYSDEWEQYIKSAEREVNPSAAPDLN